MSEYFDTFIEINSVATHVLQYGLKQPLTEQNKADEPVILLMIPGNPGEVEYYKDFLAHINSEIKLPVIGVSHTGANVLPNDLTNPSINDNPELYSLNGQIVHKMSFISKFISEKCKLILMGHSIGSYIILELLHRYPDLKAKVLHSISIFPAIDSMIDTSEGKRYEFMFRWFKYPLLGISHFFNFFSNELKQKVIPYYLGSDYQNVPECALKSTTNLLNPKCLMALIFMSNFEFDEVKELNREVIAANEKRLTFLYTEDDPWVPNQYYERIRQLYPNCDIRLLSMNINHSFVLDSHQTLTLSQIIVSLIDSVLQNLY